MHSPHVATHVFCQGPIMINRFSLLLSSILVIFSLPFLCFMFSIIISIWMVFFNEYVLFLFFQHAAKHCDFQDSSNFNKIYKSQFKIDHLKQGPSQEFEIFFSN